MFDVASASEVQNQTAASVSAAYGKPIPVTVISKYQDWQERQTLQYESMKGHLVSDFLGLKDWAQQIQLYSLTNPLILGNAYKAIKPIASRNLIANTQCFPHPQLGKVGRGILKYFGLAQAFRVPQEILTRPGLLSGEFRD